MVILLILHASSHDALWLQLMMNGAGSSSFKCKFKTAVSVLQVRERQAN